MRGERIHPIVIAAGGTGGHFFPAEALAAELTARGHRVALMTDARSGGLASPAFAGLERFVIRGAGIAGRGTLRAAQASIALAAGTLQARSILARLEPAAIVGFGGYPSVAPILATLLLRHRPAIILHEQNAVLGRANRMLCRNATTLALSFEHTTRIPPGAASTVTGNPVRPALATLAEHTYTPPTSTIHLLVTGGSLGARILSDIVPEALRLLPTPLRHRLHVTQQCRPEDLDRVRQTYAAANIPADLAPFFPDMTPLLAKAHLVIARAGASTLAELTLAGKPAILIPLPNAIDDHQTANAQSLAATGGAWMLPQSTLTPTTLATTLESILPNPDTLTTTATTARSHSHPTATTSLANLIETVSLPMGAGRTL